MTLKKREKILLAAVGVAVVIFIVNQFLCSSKNSETVQSTSKSVSRKKGISGTSNSRTTFSKGKQLQANTQWRQARIFYCNWGRDPFGGAFTKEILDSLGAKSENPYVLKAVSWKNGKAMVLINDDIIKVGETQNGLTVLAVEEDRVVCRKYGSIFSLSLGD